ncbi:MAG: GNAT family N-acetyltransferase [Anaerolineae bacterium]|nr:GNAT family N-acetyltransferase [Anaerolineae bacterium]
MTVKFRKYNPERDFLRVRDLLVQTYPWFGKLSNWRLERWNYARYFVSSMLGDPDPEQSAENIRVWEETIGIWESDKDGIVGVVNCEHSDPHFAQVLGEAFIQRHPDYDGLLDEMLTYAEATFGYDGKFRTPVQDADIVFQDAAQERGYQKNTEWPGDDSVFIVAQPLPEPKLPEGFKIKSMADENKLALRGKAFGLGFNHPDPKDWPSAATYAELQKAPDYRKDLDLYIVSPEGEYVSFCIAWYDAQNQIGILEPVGTIPGYRRRGLARAVVTEAIRRVAALGAKEMWVGSGQDFYMAAGFKKKYLTYSWVKQVH